LLLYHLILSSGILRSLTEENLLPLFVLDLDEPLLLHLLLLAQIDSLLDLLALLVPLGAHGIDFLLVFILHHLLDAELLHLLLDLDLVLLLQSEDLVCALFCLFNLLPRAHLFLLQEGDTVREQLGVTFDAMN
jgi:hypothetical protein